MRHRLEDGTSAGGLHVPVGGGCIPFRTASPEALDGSGIPTIPTETPKLVVRGLGGCEIPCEIPVSLTSAGPAASNGRVANQRTAGVAGIREEFTGS